MRIKKARKDDRHQFGSRFRRNAASVGNHGASLLVMSNKLRCAPVQAMKRQLMAWQDKNIIRENSLQLVQGPEIETKRISIRVYGPNAHVWGDFCKNLVCSEK